MDNLNSHKVPGVREAIETVGQNNVEEKSVSGFKQQNASIPVAIMALLHNKDL